MSLKGKLVSFLTVALGIAAFATFTFGQDTTTPAPQDGVKKRDKMGMHGGKREGMRGHGKFGRHGGMFGLRGITLTDAQKEQIRSIRESNKPDAAVMAELKSFHDLRKAGTALTAEQQDRIKAIREQSRAKREAVHKQILGVLTAEQKAEIEKRKQEMQQRREERRMKRPNRSGEAPKIS